MRILGINDSSHDAAVAVIENGEILFAAHSERYNGEKNTFVVDRQLLEEALKYGKPDAVAYYENRTKKRLRLLRHGGLNGQYKYLYKKLGYKLGPAEQIDHHYSHACAGYYTSTFEDACIVVLDAIGEWETATVWDAVGNKITKRASWKYPFSFGLFYSAWTDFLGLKPGQDEYILMGMAAYGDPYRFEGLVNSYFPEYNRQTYNFHQGINDIKKNVIKNDHDKFDLAAAVQLVYTKRLVEFMQRARAKTFSQNLVFMGGCALNCAANTKLLDIWREVWIMPNPGDAGSSLGAALALHGRHVEWRGPYLGHDISGEWPVEAAFDSLITTGIAPVASGRAEFGPRALGNRSLLADPRSFEMRDKVNEIKHREKFRPFAPVVMEEHAHEWFDLDRPAPFMQFAVNCKRKSEIPAVVHRDGTSRVQTVNEYQHPALYKLLQKWHRETGVPVLLNTSLNVKNQPLLNSYADALEWSQAYGHKVLS